jgi:GT2 family glycosyltransferase
MQLSVVILNYNVQHFLELCVLSVQNAIKNIDAEIIVVDNNSSDDSCKMMMERFPDVKLIQNSENVGFPKGNNLGVKAAKGEFLCILNPDTVVAEDTFTKVLSFAKNQEKLGIVGCKLVDGSGNFLPESKRGTPTPWVAMTKILGLYRFFSKNTFFNRYYAQHLLENQSGTVDILVGAFMVCKRALYNEIGGFDENCFMYADDIDLSYMSLKAGKSNYYFHDTTVIHYKGESTIKDEYYMKRFQEAMTFFYKKHFSVSIFFSVFMKIGILFFSIFKKNQSASHSKMKPENYVFVSDDDKKFNKIKQRLNTNIQMYSQVETLSEVLTEKSQTEIIFDNNYIDFKKIIQLFEKFKNRNITFKILPKNSNFIIGSNSSLDRGDVVKL